MRCVVAEGRDRAVVVRPAPLAGHVGSFRSFRFGVRGKSPVANQATLRYN
jgi:hypothetical protein